MHRSCLACWCILTILSTSVQQGDKAYQDEFKSAARVNFVRNQDQLTLDELFTWKTVHNRPKPLLEPVPASVIHGRIREQRVICSILLSKCKAYQAKTRLSFLARRTSCALRCEHHSKDWLPNLNSMFQHPNAYRQKGVHAAFKKYLLSFMKTMIDSKSVKMDFFVQNVLQRRVTVAAMKAVSLLAEAGKSSLPVARKFVENMISNIVFSGIDEMASPCDHTLADSGLVHLRVNITVEWITPAILTDLRAVLGKILRLDATRIMINPVMTKSALVNFESPKYMRIIPGTCVIQAKFIEGRYDQGSASEHSGCMKAMELATSFLSGKLHTIFAGGKFIGIKTVEVAPPLPHPEPPIKQISAGSAFPSAKVCGQEAVHETATVLSSLKRPVNGRALQEADAIKQDIVTEARRISDIEKKTAPTGFVESVRPNIGVLDDHFV